MSGQGDLHIYKLSAEVSEYIHKTTNRFWDCYQKLPAHVQNLANKQFKLLKENPNHPSLRFEKLEGFDHYWSARVTRGYRAVATKDDEGFVWFLIGSHDFVYDSLKR